VKSLKRMKWMVEEISAHNDKLLLRGPCLSIRLIMIEYFKLIDLSYFSDLVKFFYL